MSRRKKTEPHIRELDCGFGIKVTLIEQRTRWQALDLLTEVTNALRAERYGTACELLGMDEDLFTDTTMEELAAVVTVRVADLAREAGINLGATQ